MTNYLVDLDDYSGTGPFNFHGVSIIEISPLFVPGENSNEAAEMWVDKGGENYSYNVVLSTTNDVRMAISILENNENIIIAEPNYILKTRLEEVQDENTQNATSNYEQWAHTYLEMEDVWDYGFVGSNDITVAVIDSGFVQHTDLQNNMDWSTAYNAYDSSSDVVPFKNSEHGIMCAGIIGANYNDGNINGVCQSIKMIPIKQHSELEIVQVEISEGVFLPYSYSVGYYEHLLRAVKYAVINDADIISVSLSMPFDTKEMKKTIADANVLCVTSAGNNSKDMSEDTFTDSNDNEKLAALGKMHDEENWIIVGSINSSGEKAAHSNYSALYCDIFAPGEDIISLGYFGFASSPSLCTVTSGSGTSFAVPHVAAACALIMSHAPHLTPLEVKELLMSTVNEIDGFDAYCVSGGALSIKNAIIALYQDEERGAYSKGDLDGDGIIDMFDYAICKQITMDSIVPTAQQLYAADVNKDDVVDVFDYMQIKQFCNRQFYFSPW